MMELPAFTPKRARTETRQKTGPSVHDVEQLDIRALALSDVDTYREFRLRALTADPLAFTSNATDEGALPLGYWQARLGQPERNVVFGAFSRASLVGIAGLRFETERQTRHKGRLFGMAVDAGRTRRGVGGSLVTRVLNEARQRGLRQVVLTYSEGNLAAERLYLRHGFAVFGREPRAVIVRGQDVVNVHMICLLDAEGLIRDDRPAPG